MWQADVHDYYGAKLLYNFFDQFNVVKWKNSKLQSCRSRRELQFSYKNHLHPTSYWRVMIFRNFSLVTPVSVTRQDSPVTPMGVARQAFPRRKRRRMIRILPRQCMWRDYVIWSRQRDWRDQKGYTVQIIF